jgi:Ni,Fe-hydrogenase III large subunit
MSAHVAYIKPMDGIAPVLSAQPRASEIVAAGAEGTAEAQRGEVAHVTATADVYVAFGPTTVSTPSATNGHRLQSGQSKDFGNLQTGWVMAVASA